MAYLQLAENHVDNYNMLAEGSVMNNYLTIPPGFMGNEATKFVRLDYFDNLPDEEFNLTMSQLAPYQSPTLLSEKGDALVKIASFGSSFIPGVGPLVSKAVSSAGTMTTGLIAKKQERKKAKKGKTGDLKKSAIDIPNIDANVSVGDQDFSLTYEKPTTGATGNFFQKYKMPLIIGGIVLVGGYVLLQMRKK